jgi:hypothetical protein
MTIQTPFIGVSLVTKPDISYMIPKVNYSALCESHYCVQELLSSRIIIYHGFISKDVKFSREIQGDSYPSAGSISSEASGNVTGWIQDAHELQWSSTLITHCA